MPFKFWWWCKNKKVHLEKDKIYKQGVEKLNGQLDLSKYVERMREVEVLKRWIWERKQRGLCEVQIQKVIGKAEGEKDEMIKVLPPTPTSNLDIYETSLQSFFSSLSKSPLSMTDLRLLNGVFSSQQINENMLAKIAKSETEQSGIGHHGNHQNHVDHLESKFEHTYGHHHDYHHEHDQMEHTLEEFKSDTMHGEFSIEMSGDDSHSVPRRLHTFEFSKFSKESINE